MVLDKKAILNAMKLKQEKVEIDGGSVIVQEVSAAEYMEVYSSEAVKSNNEFDGTLFTSILATRCIVDAKGKRIFDDADAETLRNGSTAVYTKIALAVKRVNGLGTDSPN